MDIVFDQMLIEARRKRAFRNGDPKAQFLLEIAAQELSLYLLIALVFIMLYAFVGLSFADAFSGLTFEYNTALASRLLYFSFVTLTSTGYGDIVAIHPLARSLCNLEAIIGQLYPTILLARLVTLELTPHHQDRPN